MGAVMDIIVDIIVILFLGIGFLFILGGGRWYSPDAGFLLQTPSCRKTGHIGAFGNGHGACPV